MQEQMQAIRNKVAECISTAEREFGITMPNVDVRFDLKGRSAGVAGFVGKKFYLRFNVHHMSLGGQTWEHLLNNTVPHEVAHTVCQAFPKFGRNHDRGWQRVCLALGGNGKRCYGEDDAPEAVAAQRPWVYITTAGHQVRVTKVIHSKIQKGYTYSIRGGKGALTRACQYNYMTPPAVKAAAKPLIVNSAAPQTRPAVMATGSKANQLRAFLKQAKADVGSEAFERTIRWAVDNLGMSPTLAKTYVKNNWNKV